MRRGLVAGQVVMAIGLGVLSGVLWVWLAPRVGVTVVDGVANYAEEYPEHFAAADLWLGILLMISGVLIGVATCLELHRSGFSPAVAPLAVMVVANLLCATTAVAVGLLLAGGGPGLEDAAIESGSYELPLQLGAWGVALLGVLASLVTVLIYAAVAREPHAVDPDPT